MSGKLEIIAPDRRRHGEQVVDFICKAFGNYFEQHAQARISLLFKSHYSFKASRIGLIDGQIATHFGIVDYQMRVGSATLRTAGVSAVATHPQYRKKGLMLETGQACLAGLRDSGFDFSLLFGIKDFYYRLDYTRAWSPADYVITQSLLDDRAPKLRLRREPCAPTAELARLYNRHFRDVTGTAVRPTYRAWTPWNPSDKRELFTWRSRSGVMEGYIVVKDANAQLEVFEGVGDAEEIMDAVTQLARRFSCHEIRFITVPAKSALGRHLRRGTAECQQRIRRNAGPLARIVRLVSSLEKLSNEFGRRLGASGLSDYRGELLISDNCESTVLSIARGNVSIHPGKAACRNRLIAGREISQLILGTDDPRETIAACNMKLAGDARFLVPALFPEQRPMLSQYDQF